MKMSKRVYRTEPQIMVAILKECLVPSGITKIVYNNNLNFELATKYFIKMTRKGYLTIEKHNNRKWYKTTELGESMIGILVNVVQVIEEIRT
jgi:predicted transcriptional regulator